MLLISGKMALTQQSTGIGDWFLAVEDGERPMWQPTTSDLVVFFISQNQLLRIEMATASIAAAALSTNCFLKVSLGSSSPSPIIGKAASSNTA